MTTTNLKAQNNSFENDVKTIDALMKASYEVVSGEKGAKRQWERDNHLHHPKAVYSYFDREQKKQATMTLQEFHKETDEMIFGTAFYENEINREVRIFGNIAHVWSNIEVVNPVINQALTDANCTWDDIDAIAVTYAPGLIGSLLIGTLAARTYAIIKNNHYTPFITSKPTSTPIFCATINRNFQCWR